MTIASNLYGSKVFSEHPIALWTLDDNISFVSLIDNSDRDFNNWNLTNATVGVAEEYPTAPFPDSIFSMIEGTTPDVEFEAYSQNLFNLNSLNQELNNFAINFYIYSESTTVLYYEFGYRYLDPFTGTYIEDVRRVFDSRFKTWIRLGETFSIPSVNSQVQMVLRIYATDSGGPYNFTMNGLSIGQWSETTSAKSLGVSPIPLPSDIQTIIGDMNAVGIPITPYGISQDFGYFLSENGRMLAYNGGVAMVFGSDNVTRVVDSEDGLPSVIFPGLGILNETGRYNVYTVEMWLRLQNNSDESVRIWGPLASDDGLYVKDGFIALAIGNQIGSYFVSEWYRPMLIHIIIRSDGASLMINGDTVINLSFFDQSLVLPYSDEDWVGIYSNKDISLFEIDCYSVMPYIVPTQVAKRRFVWGQGVETPENINSAYEGTTAFIDYPFAKYTGNQLYPDINRWDAGYFNNLIASRTSASVPDYELPNIFLGEKTLEDLYADNYAIQDPDHEYRISFRPNATWTDQAYLNFPTMNVLASTVRGVYGIFEITNPTTTKQPLILFANTTTSDRFLISIDGTTVSYELTTNGVTTEFDTFEVVEEEHFIVGLHLSRLFDSYGKIVTDFFGSPDLLQVYVGGDGVTTFVGDIYRVGFSDQTNIDKIEDYFQEDGIAIPDEDALLTSHLASYTLMPVFNFNRFYFDIGVSSYWEEYFPLSLFGTYAIDSRGRQYYDLDFLQYNIGYPTIYDEIETEVTGSWTYEELRQEYTLPVERPYSVLDNEFITGYSDYDDLENKVVKTIEYDFSKSSVRSYITFQRVSKGANRPINDFEYEQSLPATNVLDVPTYANQFNTKFEIKDQSIIYPPRSENLANVAVVVHLDINVNGIKTNPINLRRLAISSKALSETSFNEIGTRFGTPLYPYKKTGFYFDTKAKNPYSIYKDSNPYLYLTEHSGIQSLGRRELDIERGINMPINVSQFSDFKVSAMQIWVKYSDDIFPQVGVPLFNLDSRNVDIDFNIISDESTNRGKLYATNSENRQIYDNIVFYQDGIPVINPHLVKDEWTVLGMSFIEPLEFSGYLGGINMHQSAVFNDVSYYRATGLQEIQSVTLRPWIRVLNDPGIDPLDDLEWQYWLDNADSWNQVLKINELAIYGVSPVTLFNSYMGTNRQVVDDGDGLVVQDNGITIFTGAEWSDYFRKPV